MRGVLPRRRRGRGLQAGCAHGRGARAARHLLRLPSGPAAGSSAARRRLRRPARQVMVSPGWAQLTARPSGLSRVSVSAASSGTVTTRIVSVLPSLNRTVTSVNPVDVEDGSIESAVPGTPLRARCRARSMARSCSRRYRVSLLDREWPGFDRTSIGARLPASGRSWRRTPVGRQTGRAAGGRSPGRSRLGHDSDVGARRVPALWPDGPGLVVGDRSRDDDVVSLAPVGGCRDAVPGSEL